MSPSKIRPWPAREGAVPSAAPAVGVLQGTSQTCDPGARSRRLGWGCRHRAAAVGPSMTPRKREAGCCSAVAGNPQFSGRCLPGRSSHAEQAGASGSLPPVKPGRAAAMLGADPHSGRHGGCGSPCPAPVRKAWQPGCLGGYTPASVPAAGGPSSSVVLRLQLGGRYGETDGRKGLCQ